VDWFPIFEIAWQRRKPGFKIMFLRQPNPYYQHADKNNHELSSRTINVENLPTDCLEGNIFELFHRFGRIEEIVMDRINPSNPVGYVRYQLAEFGQAAVFAMHGKVVAGRQLRYLKYK
jgi:RNA recognition motif-containing protein